MRAPSKATVPGSRRDEAEDDLHRRRFAAGVAAEQADDAALADCEREVEMRLHRAVKGVDAVEARAAAGSCRGLRSRSARRPTSLWPR